jgi:hypothetical protein
MACHCLLLKNQNEFYSLLKSHDPDLVLKMAKCVVNACKKNKDKVDIFDITFKNASSMLFSIEKSQYKELLKNCMDDLIKIEAYEVCADIQKILDKKTRTRKITQQV